MLAIIAAVDKRGCIGKGGGIPWDCPEDLAFFAEKTKGKSVLVGRSTYDALPSTLPGRDVYVLSHDETYIPRGQNATRVGSVDEGIAALGDHGFVIGGAKLYEAALPSVDRIVLSRIPVTVADGDTFFPEYDEFEWALVASKRLPTFTVDILERRS